MPEVLPALHYGVYYHVYNRGINRGDIFFEEENYDYFLRLYEKYIVPIARTYAYCLLKNHFHLLIKIRAEDEIQKTREFFKTSRVSSSLSQQFSNFFNAYAKAINQSYGRIGSLFQERFRRKEIDFGQHLQRCSIISTLIPNYMKLQKIFVIILILHISNI